MKNNNWLSKYIKKNGKKGYIYKKKLYLSEKQILKLIPKGCYCYDNDGRCPFLTIDEKYPEQLNGYCTLLEKGDWMGEDGTSELWDECKNCDINDDDESLYMMCGDENVVIEKDY